MANMTTTAQSKSSGLNYRFRDPRLKKSAEAALAEMKACRRDGRRLVKISTLGGDPEESFEQALASLAFSYVKDKAPRLLEYVKGFQLVDRNEDNTKAIGVFGFLLGKKKWVYAPVFFLNGDIKGHELLYLKSQDRFVPLKENWVNYLMSRDPQILGNQSPETVRSLGIMQPDVESLSSPPYSKYGEWMHPFVESLAELTTRPPNTLEKYAEVARGDFVPQLCSNALWAARMMKNACDNYPEINRLCNHFYGTGWLKRSVETLQDKATKQVGQIGGDGSSVLGDTIENADAEKRREEMDEVIEKDASPILFGHRMKRARDSHSVEIRSFESLTATPNNGDLSESERETMFRDGYLVRDYRSGEETTRVYSTEKPCELITPDDTGLFDVLTRPGKFVETLIIQNPATAKGRCDCATVLQIDEPRDWVNTHSSTVYTKPQRRNKSQQREWFDSLQDLDVTNLSEDDVYVVVSLSTGSNLDGTVPFQIERKLDDKGRYQVRWYDENDTGRPGYLRGAVDRFFGMDHFHDHSSRAGYMPYENELKGRGDLIFFSDRQGVKLKSVSGMLLIPRNAKVIPVSSTEQKTYGGSEPIQIDTYKSKNPGLEPGNWADLQAQILQKTAELKIYADGEEVSINAGPLVSKKSALFELIRDYGLREKTAKHVIREAEVYRRKGKPFSARVKYAQGYPALGPGPSAPAIPEPNYGYEEATGAMMQNPQEENIAVPDLSSGMTDPAIFDTSPDAMPDPMAMQTAQQAGQMGQKQVFDTSMLTGMLNVVREDSVVDRYSAKLLPALDSLGRLIFLFNWHPDKFQERYGKADMPELEDSLRNCFEQVGDLVLFLREKNVAPVFGDGALSHPDIQDSAD